MEPTEAHGPGRGAGIEPSTPAREWDLLTLVPLIAIVLLALTVGAALWYVRGSEDARARIQLATDALWVEQELRFQLSVDEDAVARAALDEAGVDAATLAARARLQVANNPEILSIAWVDADGTVEHMVPEGAAILAPLPPAVPTARPAYGALARGPDGAPVVALAVRRAPGGAVVATVSVQSLLDRHVPWWVAERYSVELTDSDGQAIAARAMAPGIAGAPSHVISFDPPLHGVLLRITVRDVKSDAARLLLMGGVIGLSAFAVLALLVLWRNVGRRRRAELELRREVAFRRSMEGSLTVGLRAKDHAGRILYVNRAFCDLVGWPAEDLIGRVPPMPYWDEARMAETLARQRRLAEGGVGRQSFETRFRARDGRLIDVQVFEAPLIDARGKQLGWMGSIIDVTEAKAAAERARIQEGTLAQTGRLVMLGEMASTLAHELNQPLSAIASYAVGTLNLLDRGESDPQTLRPALEKLAKQSDRAGQIIRRVQDFARKRESRFGPLDLHEVVTETLAFLAADARAHQVQLVLETLGTLPARVEADRILIEQLLINLIRNGMEAMTATRSGDAIVVTLETTEASVELRVADQGAGIAPGLEDRLFDAFVSSKSEGMGLGLKICRSITELHHGQLSHRPNPGGGTIFILSLPPVALQAEVAK